MDILGYTIANPDKFHRAIYGVVGREGKAIGGVGENAGDMEKIAEYDRIGGLILKGKNKVKTGSFYDFEKRCPRKEPEVALMFKDLEGNRVEIKEDEEIPVEVKAAERIREKKLDGEKKKHAKKKDDEE